RFENGSMQALTGIANGRDPLHCRALICPRYFCLDLLHPFLAAEVSRLVLGAVLTAVTIPLWLLETALCYTKAIALCYTKAIVVGLRCTSKAQLTGTER
ncbi:hypothetical protein DYB38_013770, partial [Aphanomyces astaci]